VENLVNCRREPFFEHLHYVSVKVRLTLGQVHDLPEASLRELTQEEEDKRLEALFLGAGPSPAAERARLDEAVDPLEDDLCEALDLLLDAALLVQLLRAQQLIRAHLDEDLHGLPKEGDQVQVLGAAVQGLREEDLEDRQALNGNVVARGDKGDVDVAHVLLVAEAIATVLRGVLDETEDGATELHIDCVRAARRAQKGIHLGDDCFAEPLSQVCVKDHLVLASPVDPTEEPSETAEEHLVLG